MSTESSFRLDKRQSTAFARLAVAATGTGTGTGTGLECDSSLDPTRTPAGQAIRLRQTEPASATCEKERNA